MKTSISLALFSFAALVFLSGCDKKSNNSAGVPSVYDPYSPHNPGGNLQLPYLFTGRAEVVNPVLYRKFLRGDFCRRVQSDCKRIDGRPELALGVTKLNLSSSQDIAKLTVRIAPDRGFFFGGPKLMQYLVGVRRNGSQSQFEGIALDRDRDGRVAPRLKFVGSGDLSNGFITISVLFDNNLMLEARLFSRR